MSEQLYLFTHDLDSPPICSTCGGHPCKFRCFSQGYSKWCCNKCAQLDQSIKERIKQTKIQRFGFENNSQSPQFKKRMRQIQVDRTDQQKQDILDKRMATCMLRYGVYHPCKSLDVKSKIRDTQLKNVQEIQQKSKEGCFELHGCHYTGQIQSKITRTMQTFLDKYDGHPFRMKSNGKRIIEDILQCDFNQSRCKRYVLVETIGGEFKVFKDKPDCLMEDVKQITTLDSMWEVIVFKYCRINGIEFEYQPDISFEYEYDGKTHTYHPDFKIGDNKGRPLLQ